MNNFKPLRKEMTKIANQNGTLPEEERKFFLWLDVEDFLLPRDQYIQNHRDSAVSTFDVVKDGKWYEKGEMGWWGMTHNEKEQAEWNRQFNELLNNLPDDTILTVVDCHI